MGKSKKQKKRTTKVNPLGIPSIKDVSEDVLHDEHLGPMQAILEQIQSPSVNDKINGLQLLAVLSMNKEKIELICSSEMIRTVAPLLLDKNQSIRHATAGALRNISTNGPEMCDYLVEQDVLTALLTLLTEYANETDWKPNIESIFSQLDEKSDTFLHTINLLWNLCESTSVTLEFLNQAHLLPSFRRCLDYENFGMEIAIAVAQCLLIISEENPKCWYGLNEFVSDLVSLLSIEGSHAHVYLSCLTAGILSNVPSLSAAHLTEIFSTLAKSLEIDHRTELGCITSIIPLTETRKSSVDIIENFDEMNEEETEEEAFERRRKEDLPLEIELQIKKVEFLLDAQRTAAEIITNFCSSEDSKWLDEDELSDTGSINDYESSENDKLSECKEELPRDILEVIQAFSIVEKLWQRAQPIQDNVERILWENNKTLHKKVNSLRASNLLCLQNLCNEMTIENLGGHKAVYNVWLDLGQQVFQNSQNIFVLEPCTSLMRATLDHLKDYSHLFDQMTSNDLQLMLNGVQNCSESEIRANLLRMLGTLGCLLKEELVKIILEFIMGICSLEQDAWTIAEALDALMDIFYKNDWKQISHELNLLRKSKELEKLLKNKMREQKHKLSDRYPAVMTVRTNFSRFTKYIEDMMKDYVPTVV